MNRHATKCSYLKANVRPLVQRYYKRIQESLQFLTGEIFEDPNDPRQWLQMHPKDGIHYLNSRAFAQQIYSILMTPASQDRTIKLLSIGLPPIYAATSRRFNSEEWFDTVWPKLKPRVLCLNCVGIYWLGYPEEQAQAKNFLMAYANEDFNSPAQYLKWYRQHILHLSY